MSKTYPSSITDMSTRQMIQYILKKLKMQTGGTPPVIQDLQSVTEEGAGTDVQVFFNNGAMSVYTIDAVTPSNDVLLDTPLEIRVYN